MFSIGDISRILELRGAREYISNEFKHYPKTKNVAYSLILFGVLFASLHICWELIISDYYNISVWGREYIFIASILCFQMFLVLLAVSVVVNMAKRPKFGKGSFRVLLADFTGDNFFGGESRVSDLVWHALSGLSVDRFKGIESIRLLSCVDTELDEVASPEILRIAERKATEILEEKKADLIIWGGVISRNGKVILYLYFTSSNQMKVDRYGYDEEKLIMEKKFWDDFEEIVRFVIISKAEEVLVQRKKFIMDETKDIINMIEKKLKREKSQISEEVIELEVTRAKLAFLLGEHTGDKTSVDKAAKILEGIIKIGKRSDSKQVIMGQIIYGDIFYWLGQRHGGSYWDKAISTYRLILKNSVERLSPDMRALVMCKCGNALCAKAEFSHDGKMLKEAEKYLEKALEIFTLKSDPVNWAMVQHGLGALHSVLGDVTHIDQEYLLSIRHFENVLKIWTEKKLPIKWAITQRDLANSYFKLGKSKKSLNDLDNAKSACLKAIKVWNVKDSPVNVAWNKLALANVYFQLGKLKRSPSHYRQALDIYRSLLEIWDFESAKRHWAGVTLNIAEALHDLGELEKSPELYTEAIIYFKKSLKALDKKSEKYLVSYARNFIKITKEKLAKITIQE